jgi:fermentation-respiration switch protein FrsA (DUF1100 family)
MRSVVVLRRVALVAAVVVAAIAIAMLALQRQILFPRDMCVPRADAGAAVPGVERWSLQVEDGTVDVWFLPGDGVSASAPGPLVVFAHGNAELIDDWPEMLERYRRLGVSVLLPEYRGYGRSAGAPSQEAIVADFERAYDLAIARDDVDAERVVLHGRSLGGGVACALALRRPAAAIVLQSTFTGVADLALAFGVPRFMVRDPFDNLAALRGLEVPVLIVHGTRDGLIPVDHARALAGAAHDAKLVLVDADHNDCPPDWGAFWREVEGFLREKTVLR